MNIVKGKFVMSYQSGLLSYALNIQVQIEEKIFVSSVYAVIQKEQFYFVLF